MKPIHSLPKFREFHFDGSFAMISGFFTTHILREINFGGFRSSKKKAIFAILGAVNVVDLVNFSIQKVQKCLKIKIQRL